MTILDQKNIDYLESFNIPIELELGYDDDKDKWCIRVYTLNETLLKHDFIDTTLSVVLSDDYEELKKSIIETIENLKDRVQVTSNL